MPGETIDVPDTRIAAGGHYQARNDFDDHTRRLAQPLVRATRDQNLPTSFAQQRLWFLEQLQSGSATYHLTAALQIKGPLDAQVLERSLNEIIRRHESLRTTFDSSGGDLAQVIASSLKLKLTTVDLRALADKSFDRQMKRVATEQARQPFDLQRGPLLRATLLRRGADDHVILLTLHHIVFDRWSMNVFIKEIATLYEAFSKGEPSPLPDLAVQYADYALWQRSALQVGTLDTQLDYWRHQLAGAPRLLEIPTDRPRPALQTFKAGTRTFTLSREVTNSLKELSKQEGATMFVTLLAAFNTLLSRYSGQEDILVGSPTAGRSRMEIQCLIGLFSNMLVFRTDLSGRANFRQLLGRIRDTTLDAFAHQDLPFEKLIEELQPERSLNHTPLFQVVFTLQNAQTDTLTSSGLVLRALEVDSSTSRFDLTLSMIEREHELKGSLEYNRDLFDDETIERMIGHFECLLDAIVANPDQPVSQLQMLTPDERHQILVKWNNTGNDYPNSECLHNLFETQAERTPESGAVVFADDELSYGELNRKANQLARYLQAAGIGPGMLVGVCVERSLEMVIGLLGILKSGAAYLPIDPAYPLERQAFILEDSRASVLLTQQRLLKSLPTNTAKIICLDAEWKTISRESDEPTSSRVTSEDIAYVIYTSGSTGRPKGVQITHRAVVNLLFSMADRVSFTTKDVLLAVTSLSFDIAVLELFLPIIFGGKVIVAGREAVADGHSLIQLQEAHGVTVMQATPATWNLLLKAGWRNGGGLRVLCGGEALSRNLAAGLLARTDCLLNVYGPTETTIWSTVSRINSTEESISIGRPIDNTQIYLLDDHFNPVPVGIPGQLYIGGDGLASGYLNLPELTAEKFTPDPFGGKPGARIYNTGDRARYLPDGQIEFLGRADHQVKVRGFRIELGEIEATLAQHAAIERVVVVARDEGPDEKRLVAYVVTLRDPGPTAAELRTFIKDKLPDYIIPSAFVFLSRMPLTPNGKIDRMALPAPDQSLDIAQYVRPRDPLERQLTEIWEEILKVHPIGICDNFFELGGNSLSSIRMVDRTERMIGRRIPLAAMFEMPTVEHLAALLLKQETDNAGSIVEVQKGGVKRPFFFLHGDFNGGGFYCRNLARGLGDERPFYAIQPHGLDGRSIPLTIEAMAESHLQTLRGVQPRGPYLLGGYCNGAAVAFEIARLLQAQGEKIELLVLLCFSVNNALRFKLLYNLINHAGGAERFQSEERLRRFLEYRGKLSRVREIKDYYKGRLGEFSRMRISEQVSFARKKTLTTLTNLGRSLASIQTNRNTQASSFDSHSSSSSEGDRRQLATAAYNRAILGYVPRPYLGPVTVLWPSELSLEDPHDPTAGWSRVATAVEVQRVPGGHITCLTKHVHDLAKTLKSCLDESHGY